MRLRKLIFKPEHNCWRISQLKHGRMLVDCANFYRALHAAICNAQHSIFIVGWDIDSRMRLLRGEDEKHAHAPSRALDLIAWKAQDNPHIPIYLLRWDASLAFMDEREMAAKRIWELNTPENVHVWLDDTIPIGGAHHQKLIVVDDELVFSGGMDIAPQRWDEREHRTVEPERVDEDGRYDPYHDIQIMMDGPVVQDLAEWVRWRWERSAGYKAIAMRDILDPGADAPVPAWPQVFQPCFENMEMAISRTLPVMKDIGPVQETRQMVLDLIAEAKYFIYIENQFLAYQEVARALNQRLRNCPELKILLISSYNPQGVFEAEGLWAERIDFKKVLEQGIDPDRVLMAYPYTLDNQAHVRNKRIHSKIFVVDDHYLIVGSSNINHRSMSLDTECDIVLKASNAVQRASIAEARNDLIAEHTGLSMAVIQEKIDQSAPLNALKGKADVEVYGLKEMQDTDFTNGEYKFLARRVADPAQPLIPPLSIPLPGKKVPILIRNPRRHVFFGTLLFLGLLFGALSYLLHSAEISDPQAVTTLLTQLRTSPFSFIYVCLLFILGGVIFFPLTALYLATAAVFGPVLGLVYGMSGALLSAAISFAIGHGLGLKGLRRLAGERVRQIDHKLRDSGIMGVVLIRMVPITPFSLLNLAAGISSVRFSDFMMGTFLGLLPGFIAQGLVGASLVNILLNPTPLTVSYLVIGLVMWFALVLSSHKLANILQKKKISSNHHATT